MRNISYLPVPVLGFQFSGEQCGMAEAFVRSIISDADHGINSIHPPSASTECKEKSLLLSLFKI